MNEIIYLEPDNDIAAVIGRIKAIEKDLITLVIPRGGTIAQSIVNLKLIKRESEKKGKEISLVTGDKISKNLASQVGITVYDNVNEAKSAVPRHAPEPELSPKPTSDVPEYINASQNAGIKINRYNKDEDELEQGEAESEDENGEDDDPRNEEEKGLENGSKNNQEPIQEKIIEKHFTHEIVREQPKEEGKATEKVDEIIKPISPNEVEEFDKKMTPTYTGARRRNLSSKRKVLLIILIVFIVAIAGLSYIFLPKADAILTLKADDLAATSEVTLDSSLSDKNLETLTLPAVTVLQEDELSKDIASTGKKNVGEKAKGEIAFYNYWDANPQVLAAGTELSASGKKFTTDIVVTIPGATIILQAGVLKTTPGTVNGKITASSAGEDSNLDATKFVITSFSGEKREKVYGQSSAKLLGGTTKEVIVVAEADITKAKTDMTTELSATIAEKANEEATSNDKKILVSSIKDEVISFETSAKADDETGNFKATLKLKTTALAFSEPQLREMLIEKIKKDIGENQMIVDENKLNIEYEISAVDTAKGTAKLSVKYSGKTGRLISETDVTDKITGKKFGTAKIEAEKIEGVEKVEIKIWPTALTHMPFIKSRITVKFSYPEE